MNIAARPVAAPNYDSYSSVDPNAELRQSEILSNITYSFLEPSSDDSGRMDMRSGTLSYVIVLTPDCDLLQDFRDRRDKRASKLFNVLMFGAEEAGQAKDRIGYNTKEWKHVQQNVFDQFYYLTAIKADTDLRGRGMPDLVIDFKRYFTLPSGEIYRQCALAEPDKAFRRCRLTDLWREDLQRRAMSYMQRVGLPDRLDTQ